MEHIGFGIQSSPRIIPIARADHPTRHIVTMKLEERILRYVSASGQSRPVHFKFVGMERCPVHDSKYVIAAREGFFRDDTIWKLAL